MKIKPVETKFATYRHEFHFPIVATKIMITLRFPHDDEMSNGMCYTPPQMSLRKITTLKTSRIFCEGILWPSFLQKFRFKLYFLNGLHAGDFFYTFQTITTESFEYMLVFGVDKDLRRAASSSHLFTCIIF